MKEFGEFIPELPVQAQEGTTSAPPIDSSSTQAQSHVNAEALKLPPLQIDKSGGIIFEERKSRKDQKPGTVIIVDPSTGTPTVERRFGKRGGYVGGGVNPTTNEGHLTGGFEIGKIGMDGKVIWDRKNKKLSGSAKVIHMDKKVGVGGKVDITKKPQAISSDELALAA